MTPELVWSGGEWLEGPLWMPEPGCVRVSDIPNNRILDVYPSTGEMRVHRAAAEFANGRTRDIDGSIVQCSHGRRAVERESGADVQTIVGRWSGGRFNSPNDVVVAADGSIWFTDPPYGIDPSGREGHPGEPEYGGCYVFRFADGIAEPVVTDMVHPNGLAFSPDEALLYVADSGGAGNADWPHHLRVYEVRSGRGEVFAEIDAAAPDGLRVDAAGNVVTSAGERVQMYSPSGELLLSIDFPEAVSNLCQGEDGHWYVTATTSLYRIPSAAFGDHRRM